MAEAKTKEQLEAEWWERWHAEDFTWEGLAKKSLDGWFIEGGTLRRKPTGQIYGQAKKSLPMLGPRQEATLQDYWRADPDTGRLRTDQEMGDELVRVSGQALFHRVHLPLAYVDGTPTEKSKSINSALDEHISLRMRATTETQWLGNSVDRELSPSDGRAQFQGGVWPNTSFRSSPRASSLHLRFEFAFFAGRVAFDRANFSGDTNFDDVFFSKRVNFDGAKIVGDASFNRAIFVEEARFEDVSFSGFTKFSWANFLAEAQFNQSTFSFAHFDNATVFGEANFLAATFSMDASFRGAIFNGEVSFESARFSAAAGFIRAKFSEDADFSDAVFARPTYFQGATFLGNVRCYRATFSEEVGFTAATFARIVRFDNAKFLGYVSFNGANFSGDASFETAFFSGLAGFESAHFSGISFSGAIFERPVTFAKVVWSEQPEHWHAAFEQTIFRETVSFRDAGFKALAAFDGAILERGVQFDEPSEAEAEKRFNSELRGAVDAARRDEQILVAQHAEIIEFGDIEEASSVPHSGVHVYVGEQRELRLRQLERGCRVLKQAMEKSSNKSREQLLYRFELRARRAQRYLPVGEKFFSYLYGWASDYGASIVRPVLWLGALLLIFGLAYWGFATGFRIDSSAPIAWDALAEALSVSASRVFPFGAFDWVTRDWMDAREGQGGAGLVLVLGLLATLQTLLALGLVFLFGLAIRRRFQIS